MTKLLAEAIEKVMALPEPEQNIAAEFLMGFVDTESRRFQLSEDQLREVERAKHEAREGKFATGAEMKMLWRRFGL